MCEKYQVSVFCCQEPGLNGWMRDDASMLCERQTALRGSAITGWTVYIGRFTLHWMVYSFEKLPNAYDIKFSWLWKEACYDRNTLPLRIFCEQNKPHLSENVKFKSVLFPVLLPPLILQFSTALTKQPVQIFSFSTTKYFQTAKIEDGMNCFVRFPLWYNLLKKC